MKITRMNRLGMRFQLERYSDTTTEITLTNNDGSSTSLIVKAELDKLNQSWYDWMHKDMYIQDAFNYLSADEREFILTGITEEEWDEIFADEDDTEDDSGDEILN